MVLKVFLIIALVSSLPTTTRSCGESLAALLSTQSDFIVEGRASNGQEALAIVHEHPPDVLLLDLFMPEGDGF